MENASKALLIAGAILLVIAIIAIGMTILGQGQDVVDKTGGQIGAMAVNAHNTQFGDLYDGAIIEGSELKRIATAAASNNNQTMANKVADVIITVGTATVTGTTTTPAAASIGTIQNNRDYAITAVTYNADGALISFTATVR